MVNKHLLSVIAFANDLVKSGALSSDERTALKKVVKELRYAMKIKDLSLVEKAIGKISKLLVECRESQP